MFNINILTVIGVNIAQSSLRKKLNAHFQGCEKDMLCYLIDDGGHLILSNDEDDEYNVSINFNLL